MEPSLSIWVYCALVMLGMMLIWGGLFLSLQRSTSTTIFSLLFHVLILSSLGSVVCLGHSLRKQEQQLAAAQREFDEKARQFRDREYRLAIREQQAGDLNAQMTWLTGVIDNLKVVKSNIETELGRLKERKTNAETKVRVWLHDSHRVLEIRYGKF